MENKFTAGENTMKTRKAFTLTELVVGIMVMAITYAAMSLSSSAAKQTAQHEAERLAAYIFRTIQKADRMHKRFDMDTDFQTNSAGNNEYYVTIDWGGGISDTSFRASAGCRYTDNFPGEQGKISYNVENKRFQKPNSSAMSGGTITITDSEGEKYYVIIALDEGRIRLSETEPQ